MYVPIQNFCINLGQEKMLDKGQEMKMKRYISE